MLTEFAPSQHLIDAVADAVMARRGKAHGKRIRFLCPAHADNDPSADFDTERLVWTCRQCHAGGGLTDLAKLLDIDLAEYQDEITIIHRNGNGHHKETIPPLTFAAWCETRKLDADFLRDFYGIEETRHKRRPAIRYETKRGYRIRYLDSNKPKATWETTGSGQTLYNLGEALLLSDERVYLVNGEPSVWACQQRGVPAFCLCTGEMAPSDAACAPLRDAVGGRTVCVVYDRDEAGQKGARQAVAAMQAAGIKAVALILPDTLPDNGDVDDLHRITGAGLGAALAGLAEIVEHQRIDFAAEERKLWTDRLQDSGIAISDLPYWYERICTAYRPLGRMFDTDDQHNSWLPLMFMPFWSSFWPGIRIQNLNLCVWCLGLGATGRGKNAALDAFHELVTTVHQNTSPEPIIHFTSGTPEGMWRDLDGTGKRMILYQDEWGGWLKQMRRDHMTSAREALCTLYDGRVTGYRTSKGPVTIVKPHVVAAATTTLNSFVGNLTLEDVTNGYINRFAICAPDQLDFSPDFDAMASWDIDQLATDLTMHIRKHGEIQAAVHDTTSTSQDPEILREYANYLGLNTGRKITLEEQLTNPTTPGGRPFARAKKIATLLALAEYIPETTTYREKRCVVISERHVEIAIALTEAGVAYADRAMAQVEQSDDYQLTEKVERVLGNYPIGLSQRDLCRKLHRKASEVEIALKLLSRDGKVGRETLGGTELWSLKRI